jgi:hypothetical protein
MDTVEAKLHLHLTSFLKRPLILPPFFSDLLSYPPPDLIVLILLCGFTPSESPLACVRHVF